MSPPPSAQPEPNKRAKRVVNEAQRLHDIKERYSIFLWLQEMAGMKIAFTGITALLLASAAVAGSPDSSFYKNAAEGGMSEVELGQLAQQKAANPSVKDFGAMMVKDHSAANDKLKALAASKQVSLPDSPSMMQKASKTKLNMMSGESFDKSYVKGMIDDHKQDIKEFQKEASEGKDPDARAFASATLPTLQMHLEKIQAIAAAAGIKD
jgi:putative membrane protein